MQTRPWKVTYTNLEGVKDCFTFCKSKEDAHRWENILARAAYTDITIHTPQED